MPISFDELILDAIKTIVYGVLWEGTKRLFHFWGKWIDWTSPAGILLIAINVLYFGLVYLAYIRPVSFWQGVLVAVAFLSAMIMGIHINIMARVESS